MRMFRNKFCSFLLLVSVALVAACTSKTSTTVPSSDPTVSSLTFQPQDSFPGLAQAVFVVEDRLDTGWIYNDDSLLYGTRVDSVVPRFVFNHTPASAVLYTAFDTTVITGYDTVNLTVNPSLLYVLSEDQKVEKWYQVTVTVHQVDPDLFRWQRLTDSAFPPVAGEQKAFWINSGISLLQSDGTKVRLIRSADGSNWTEQTVSGLPADCRVRSIIEADGMLCYAVGKTVYTSTDAANWTVQDFSAETYSFVSMLMSYNDSIWALVERGDSLMLVVSRDATTFALRGDMPDNFPVSDFAAVNFLSRTYRSRTLIVGGYDRHGNALNSRWAVEYSPERGYRWTNYSIEQPSFNDLTGASLIFYNDRLYMFGGATDNYKIGEADMLESVDEGMNWTVPDSTHNCLPDNYRSRTRQTVFVSNGDVYIIGGQSRTEVFTDVFRGRLNSIDWETKD